jgi:ribonuclease H
MHIYVDGSYNPQTAHWGGGAAILDDEETEVLHTIQVTDFDSNGSRQINGELASSIMSLEYVLNHSDRFEDKHVAIYYDYLGIEKWATGEWSARKDVSRDYSIRVKNLMLALKVMHQIEVSFHKVKAHSSDKYNDLADQLSKDACGVK